MKQSNNTPPKRPTKSDRIKDFSFKELVEKINSRHKKDKKNGEETKGWN